MAISKIYLQLRCQAEIDREAEGGQGDEVEIERKRNLSSKTWTLFEMGL